MITKESILLENLEQKHQQVMKANNFLHLAEAIYEFDELLDSPSLASIMKEIYTEYNQDHQELNNQIEIASASIDKAANKIIKLSKIDADVNAQIDGHIFWLNQPKSCDIGALYMRFFAINEVVAALLASKKYEKFANSLVVLNENGGIKDYLYFTNQEEIAKENEYVQRMKNVRPWGDLGVIRGFALLYNPKKTGLYLVQLDRAGHLMHKKSIEIRQDVLKKLISPGHNNPSYEGSFDNENFKHRVEKIFQHIKYRIRDETAKITSYKPKNKKFFNIIKSENATHIIFRADSKELSIEKERDSKRYKTATKVLNRIECSYAEAYKIYTGNQIYGTMTPDEIKIVENPINDFNSCFKTGLGISPILRTKNQVIIRNPSFKITS